MKIAEFCIARPVFATVVNLLILLVGIVSYDRLTLREYPNIDMPVITVETNYLGANAEIIESTVTKPLEDSLSGIEGIDFIKSISRSERSQITVQFLLSRDADAAASDVRDRVARARGRLPDEIEEPIVAKVEADAQPMMWVSLNSETRSALEVSEYADLVIQDRLQTLPGVANILLFAERRYAMRVWLDRERLAAYDVTVQDVETALRSQNVEIPSGRIESTKREFTVLSESDLESPQQFGEVILRQTEQGYLVRLKDVARIELGPKEYRQIARFNNRNSIALGVIRQSTANPLEVSTAIRKTLPELEKNLPDGMNLNVSFDSSVFVRESINAVYRTIVEAMILVALVILFFLRSIRATLIPLVTIPISLIGAMAMMYLFGFTLNTLTLLAFVIAIGLVVDDAIVVLENTYRHLEEGLSAMQAAIKGIREIGFAVVTMTITLAAVFAPIAFTTGRTGKLFIEFALTLAGAVIVSGIVAITLSPMMCSRMLKKNTRAPRPLSQRIEGWLTRVDTAYRAQLEQLQAQRKWIYIFVGFIALLIIVMFSLIKSELSPREDRGVIFGVAVAPEGATIGYMDNYAKQMEKILQSTPEAKWNFIAVGFPIVTRAFSPLGLADWSERDRSSLEIINSLTPQMMGIPGVLAFAINPASLGQSPRSQPIEFVLQTTGSYQELNGMVDELLKKMKENRGFVAPDSDLKLNKPELSVELNRDKIAALGLEVQTVGRTLETMLGGREVTRFKRNGEQYDVMVQIADENRMDPTDLKSIFVRSGSGEMVQLSNIVSLTETVAPRELNHFNKLRSATITANLTGDYTLGEALGFMEQSVREISSTAQVDYDGVSREFKQSSSSIAFIFLLALGFIYLVLAAQFESFVDPLIILLSVPLAIAGALFTITVTGGTLNIYSQIGLIALIGLISKNGILIVEFANQLQEQGKSISDAIIESAALRLRPILMTTAATILGALPLALSSGAGAESRQAIGWVIVGGMSFGTLMTLFVIPSFYLLLAAKKTHK